MAFDTNASSASVGQKPDEMVVYHEVEESVGSHEVQESLGWRVQHLEDSIENIDSLLKDHSKGHNRRNTSPRRDTELADSTVCSKAAGDSRGDAASPRLGRFRWPMDIRRASEELKKEVL